jgi:TRAP-type mannitol/chloroaromatic compound transport system permease small subunit
VAANGLAAARDGLVRGIGRMSEGFGMLAGLAALGLIGVTLVEVFARYALHAPTVWSYDVANALNGAAFILAVAMTLRRDAHVRVDILSASFSPHVREVIDRLALALLVLPALALLTWAAWSQFLRAWMTGEVDHVSPWRPQVWPIRLVLLMGLCMLVLQVFARLVSHPVREGPSSHPVT